MNTAASPGCEWLQMHLSLHLFFRCLHPDCCWSLNDVCWLPRLLWCHSGVPVSSRNRELLEMMFMYFLLLYFVCGYTLFEFFFT